MRLMSHRRNNTRLSIEALEPREVPASIAGRVFLDFDNSGVVNGPDTGIPTVTIKLSGGTLTSPLTQTTDAQGNFSFTNLAAGTYTLTETQPTTPANQSGKTMAGSVGGTNATTNTISTILLGSTTTATGYNFAEVPLVGTGGSVFEDKNGNGVKDSGDSGIANVIVTLTGTSIISGAITPKTATTDVNGNYSFTGLTPGTYMLTEAQPGAYSDGQEQNGTPAAAVTNDRFSGIDLTKTAAASSGFNFGETKNGTLAGVVFDDVNNDGVQAATGEAGIAGVKVQLTGRDHNGAVVSRTATTAATGIYTFTNLLAGTYTVHEVQPVGFADGTDKAGTSAGTVANDKVSAIVFASGATATGYTFAEKSIADVALMQTPATATINPGGTVTLTYTIRNRGSAIAAATTVLVNFGGLQFVSASAPTAFNSTTKTWTVGSLAAGASQTIRLKFRATVTGTFAPSARATTTASELSPRNNTSSSTIMVGIPTPAASATSTIGFGGGLQNLFTSFSQFNVFTRLWLFRQFFGG